MLPVKAAFSILVSLPNLTNQVKTISLVSFFHPFVSIFFHAVENVRLSYLFIAAYTFLSGLVLPYTITYSSDFPR